jgi:predicted lysophospholipase L1 biosynthesis ABC-type transport system permease subunit
LVREAIEMSRLASTGLVINLCLPLLVSSVDVTTYLTQRQQILDQESRQFLGGSLTLDYMEQAANALLMEAKQREYDQALATLEFPPAMHFFKAKPLMLQSEVYQIIRQMPKGLLIPHVYLRTAIHFRT